MQKENDNIDGVGAVTIAIADTYSMLHNNSQAEKYYNKGIEILRTSDDSILLASSLLNSGDHYFNTKNYDHALRNFEESGKIFRKLNYLKGTAYNLGNVGMVYAEQGKDELAKANMNEAITILEAQKEYYPISVYLTYMADIYAKNNKMKAAISFADRSLDLAKRYNLKDQISESNLNLAELYEKDKDFEKAFNFYKDHITYRDSLINLSSVQNIAEMRADYEVSQKQAEVDLLSQQKRTQKIIVISTAVALFLLMLLAIGLQRRNRFIRRTSKIIEEERNRSDELLLNILPEKTAKELKSFGKVRSHRFESVSVLFTDFKDFSSYAEDIDPEFLVESVDYYFSKFDEIIEKYDLEKIKTVGDSYMCAGGLPFPSSDHAVRIVMAALEIAKFVESCREDEDCNKIPFEIRIGINTGPVVAGVVGKKKFAYDIWGDTVNIASRMESNSESGKVNISEATHELVKEYFNCEYRGKIFAKNKGLLKMYYVRNIDKAIDISHILENSGLLSSER